MTFISGNNSLIEINIRTTLAIGLFISCVLITAISATSWRALDTLYQQTESLVQASEVKTSLVYDMRIAARERNLNLMHIILLKDDFLIDDEWMRFRHQGGLFLQAREKFIALGINEQEKKLLEEQRALSVETVALQYKIFEAVENSDRDKAIELSGVALDYQQKVFEKINDLLNIQKQTNAIKIEKARTFETDATKKIIYLSITVILIMILMTVYMVKRLSEQARYIKNEALKFKALIEGSMDAVLVLDMHNVIDCNGNALKMFSVNTLKELNETSLDYLSMFSDSKKEEDNHGLFNAINHALVHTKRRYQWEFTSLEGSVFPADVELTGIEIEGKKFVQMVIRDVTERERAQEELRNANENLEHKVQERTEELKELNSKIADIARSAGMAEVASGVLHNVGNVLNSVNVSTSMLKSHVKNSKINNLEKLVGMIKDHEDDLCDFLKVDEKGKYVIPFLYGFSEQLQKDKKLQIAELDSLSDNIEHIKNIVTMQQSYTGNMGVIERVKASALMDDAVNINVSSMTKHKITVERSYDDDPEISVDKHKLMQVLVNLVSNAGHAVSNNEGDKKVTVKIHKNKDDIVFSVEDNGIGMAAEDMERIFEFGFKKRVGGHGYGLHHSAIMAKDLDGKIKVSSDGLGKGARFELSIPIKLN